MASIFLLNDNKIVSRLLQLSSEKHGYLLEEKNLPEPSRERYDIVLVDSDKYTPKTIEELKNRITFNKLGYIGIKKEAVPPEFDIHLDKPFLPSDFISLVEENAAPPETSASEHTALSEEVNLEEESLTLDMDESTPEPETEEDLDALLSSPEDQSEALEEELEALEDLEELEALGDIDDLDLSDLEEHPAVEVTPPESTPEEEQALKDLEKTEDALKELDALDEELENVDLSLDSSAVMSTGVAEQFVQTEEEPAEQTQKPLHEIEAQAVQEETLPTSEALQEEQMDKTQQTTESITEESMNAPLDQLQSVEDIESEKDYIAEELDIDTLSKEFDTLKEEEVLQALQPETIEKHEETLSAEESLPGEEILHEEIVSEGEETMVESGDVEQWIRDAVAKAITPEMIKEALQDMQVTVTLDFKKRDA